MPILNIKKNSEHIGFFLIAALCWISLWALVDHGVDMITLNKTKRLFIWLAMLIIGFTLFLLLGDGW